MGSGSYAFKFMRIKTITWRVSYGVYTSTIVLVYGTISDNECHDCQPEVIRMRTREYGVLYQLCNSTILQWLCARGQSYPIYDKLMGTQSIIKMMTAETIMTFKTTSYSP